VDDAIYGYLACISYADAMLGRLLDAIESGPNAGNTIVVMWSDHGYHHGEKLDWGKHTLWERTSNVPFLWAGPGIAKGRERGRHGEPGGHVPHPNRAVWRRRTGRGATACRWCRCLKDPKKAKDRDVLLPGMKPEEYAMMNRDWRYIRYADGTEELYDVRKDPNEWDESGQQAGNRRR
jgi:hypothetical protein